MQFKAIFQSTVAALGLVASMAHAQTVVLYSSNNTETIETALDVVKKTVPNLKVQQVTGGTGSLMKRIQAEAKNPRGDVLWSGGFGTLGAYKDLLQPYKGPGLEHVPAEFRGAA